MWKDVARNFCEAVVFSGLHLRGFVMGCSCCVLLSSGWFLTLAGVCEHMCVHARACVSAHVCMCMCECVSAWLRHFASNRLIPGSPPLKWRYGDAPWVFT